MTCLAEEEEEEEEEDRGERKERRGKRLVKEELLERGDLGSSAEEVDGAAERDNAGTLGG